MLPGVAEDNGNSLAVDWGRKVSFAWLLFGAFVEIITGSETLSVACSTLLMHLTLTNSLSP